MRDIGISRRNGKYGERVRNEIEVRDEIVKMEVQIIERGLQGVDLG